MQVPLLNSEQHWECPNCDQTSVTHEVEPHTRMHTCPGLCYLTAPMVPAGQKCKVAAVEREDYVGGAIATYDENGNAIMAVEVTREDGNDVAAFADCAGVRGEQ